MKKILSLISTVLICLSLTGMVFAESEVTVDTNKKFIYDKSNVLTENEIDELNVLANDIHDKIGYGVYFCRTDSTEDIITEAENFYNEIGGEENGVMLYINKGYWYVYLSGKAQELITEEEEDEFWRLYKSNSTYFAGVRSYLNEASFFISLYDEDLNSFTTDIEYTSTKFVNDYADVISSSCEEELESKINKLRNELKVDIVVVTTDNASGMNSHNFCNEFYRSNGYGYGKTETYSDSQGDDGDGLVILLNLDGGREIYMTVYGKCDYAMYDYGIDYATEKFVDAFLENDYDDAFLTIVDVCEMFIKRAENSDPYTKDDINEIETDYKENYYSKEPYNMAIGLGIAIVVGLIVSLIIVSVWKSQLTSVKFNDSAKVYIVNGSRILRENKDTYLYSNVTKTRRTESSSSSGGGGGGGGGSYHSSSSGGSHGGGRSF